MKAEDKDREKLPTADLNVVLLPDAATTDRLISLSELFILRKVSFAKPRKS